MLKYRMLKVKNVGKPDEGKLHVRFDEEGQVRPALYSITGRKKAVAVGRLNPVASRKTKDGGDPLKTGMNKRRVREPWVLWDRMSTRRGSMDG